MKGIGAASVGPSLNRRNFRHLGRIWRPRGAGFGPAVGQMAGRHFLPDEKRM